MKTDTMDALLPTAESNDYGTTGGKVSAYETGADTMREHEALVREEYEARLTLMREQSESCRPLLPYRKTDVVLGVGGFEGDVYTHVLQNWLERYKETRTGDKYKVAREVYNDLMSQNCRFLKVERTVDKTEKFYFLETNISKILTKIQYSMRKYTKAPDEKSKGENVGRISKRNRQSRGDEAPEQPISKRPRWEDALPSLQEYESSGGLSLLGDDATYVSLQNMFSPEDLVKEDIVKTPRTQDQRPCLNVFRQPTLQATESWQSVQAKRVSASCSELLGTTQEELDFWMSGDDAYGLPSVTDNSASSSHNPGMSSESKSSELLCIPADDDTRKCTTPVGALLEDLSPIKLSRSVDNDPSDPAPSLTSLLPVLLSEACLKRIASLNAQTTESHKFAEASAPRSAFHAPATPSPETTSINEDQPKSTNHATKSMVSSPVVSHDDDELVPTAGHNEAFKYPTTSASGKKVWPSLHPLFSSLPAPPMPVALTVEVTKKSSSAQKPNRFKTTTGKPLKAKKAVSTKPKATKTTAPKAPAVQKGCGKPRVTTNSAALSSQQPTAANPAMQLQPLQIPFQNSVASESVAHPILQMPAMLPLPGSAFMPMLPIPMTHNRVVAPTHAATALSRPLYRQACLQVLNVGRKAPHVALAPRPDPDKALGDLMDGFERVDEKAKSMGPVVRNFKKLKKAPTNGASKKASPVASKGNNFVMI